MRSTEALLTPRVLLAASAVGKLACRSKGLTVPGHEHLDPCLRAACLLSFALVAGGAGRQLRLLRP